MVFEFLKKRREKQTLDLSGNKAEEIPIPAELRKKLVSESSKSPSPRFGVSSPSSSSLPSSSTTSSSSSGAGSFFGGFFGSSPSSDSSSSSIVPAALPSSSYSSSNPSGNSLAAMEAKLQNISDRISGLIDRVELLERKMSRFDRRNSY